MPRIVSKAQNRLVRAVAADPDVARRVGMSQKTAREAIAESHGKKLGKLPERAKRKR